MLLGRPSGKTRGAVAEKPIQSRQKTNYLSTMDIKITFINNSNDQNNSNVVIFQKNTASDFEETAVAWHVIDDCGPDRSHTFNYPLNFKVGTQDSWGNLSDLLPAVNGQKWNVVRSTSGDVLTLDSTPASSQNEVEIKNCLGAGSVDAQIYKEGKLLAQKTGIAPQQKAVFQFKPTIWVGVVSDIAQGEVMNSAILSKIHTEIPLLGITKANLIMTGGGKGPTAQPFIFTWVPIA